VTALRRRRAYADREDAGHRLAGALGHLRGSDTVVLGMPRGGVLVAGVVATALGAPLDVIVVRKLGVPFEPEVAMGAVGEGGVVVLNDAIVRAATIGEEQLAAAGRVERDEVRARAARYRAGGSPVPLEGRVAVLVDDGIATGATARAACQVARAAGAARVVLAAPVGPPGVADLVPEADEVICPHQPHGFHAVGQAYEDFSEVLDGAVIAALQPRPDVR
jgi:putative phosphoribosyl transferase